MNAPHALPFTREQQNCRQQLSAYLAVRQATVALAAPLSPEDCQAQSMPDASPVKWHLAHTTWFFETFLLGRFVPDYRPEFPQYRMLFNSYYNAVGAKHPRASRGLLTRPTLAEVMTYRDRVDEAMGAAIRGAGRGPSRDEAQAREFGLLLELGINHEQQHQELILTDVKHLLSCNPSGPAYHQPHDVVKGAPAAARSGRDDGLQVISARGGGADGLRATPATAAVCFVAFDGGIVSIGHDAEGFCFDNERPLHQVLLQPFELADRLVTCGEYLAFIGAGGYQRPEFWLSLGWDTVQAEGWCLPLYWRKARNEAADQDPDGALEAFTLRGWQALDPAAPVAHLSFFEADAFARWAGARLPTEAEWEHAARQVPIDKGANLLERGLLQPCIAAARSPAVAAPAGEPASPVPGTSPGSDGPWARGPRLEQLWGDLWEWTASPYVPFPGFKASADAVGEYNGKFMCNQYVLRGGSFGTSRSHIRASYRNFFPADARWQFSGLRLARDPAPRGLAGERN